MAERELNCPICTADFPLTGEEKKGDEVFCSFCGAPGKLTAGPDEDDCEIEEDI